MSPRSSLAALALALGLLPLPAPAHDYRLGATVSYAENFSRTSYTPTARDATVLDLEGAFLHATQLAPNWTLLAALEGAAEHVREFTALDRLSAGARATLRHKFGLGLFVPVLDAGATVRAVAFRESGRSGWHQEAFASLSQRLTETWRFAATAGWESFAAAHAPFDTHARRIGLETYWDASEVWQLGAGAARLHGQLVANAAWSVYGQALGGGFGPEIQHYYSRIPWEVSDTFGPGWVAYRVDCRADFWWVQLTARLSDRTSLPLRYESVQVTNRVGVRYDSAFWSLGVLHQF